MKPGEQLIQTLNNLRKLLNKSGVERTIGLREAMGDDCPFFHKSLMIFLLNDYQELKPFITEVYELFQECERETP